MSDPVIPATPAGTTTLTAPEAAGAGVAPSPAAGAVAAPPAVAAGGPPAATDGKPATGQAATPPPAPVADFELKLPEGLKADEALKEFKGFAKETGLKPEAAQKVVDIFAKAQASATAAQVAEVAKIQQGWVDTLKTDKEFGGADFDKNAQVARKAVLKYGDTELKSFLESTGLGNHPAIVRAFHRIGKALGEDSVAGTTAATAAPTPMNDQAAFEAAMYPNTKFPPVKS